MQRCSRHGSHSFCAMICTSKQMVRLILMFSLFVTIASVSTSEKELQKHWENFKKKYHKQYSKQEEIKRRKIFENEVRSIIHHNLEYDMGMHTYREGINSYTDLTDEEFHKYMSGTIPSRNHTANATFCPEAAVPSGPLPEFVDWRRKGVVTPVKDQGRCNSCWIFSAVGAIEGQVKLKTGTLINLSEQQFLDCAPNGLGRFGDCGTGGNPENVYVTALNEGGIDTYECYPYFAAGSGGCRFNPDCIGGTITGYKSVQRSEYALQAAVAMVGPIVVIIDSIGLKRYVGGIYQNPVQAYRREMDHSVLVVGYGTANGNDYWLIKNSWSEHWGVRGYCRMIRNRNNAFNIATAATFPTV